MAEKKPLRIRQSGMASYEKNKEDRPRSEKRNAACFTNRLVANTTWMTSCPYNDPDTMPPVGPQVNWAC